MNIILGIIIAFFFLLFILGVIGGLFSMFQKDFSPSEYAGLLILIVLSVLFGMILFTGEIKIY